jgi:hypothetical protein
MITTLIFDMIVSACSEDRATLESDPSAVAGGRPIGRGPKAKGKQILTIQPGKNTSSVD